MTTHLSRHFDLFPLFRAIACAAALTGPALADTVPADPWQVIHAARAVGEAEVGRDGLRDPEITGTLGQGTPAAGLAYRVGFYGCELEQRCRTILLSARLDGAEPWAPAPEKIAQWNAGKLFGRAWIDSDGRAVLDHPVAMAGGLPQETLDAVFAAWVLALGEFAEYLDFPSE